MRKNIKLQEKIGGQLNINKTLQSWGPKFLVLLFLFLLSSTGFGYRCFWYVVTPGGDIGEDNTGTTAGQASVGHVTGSTTYGNGTYGFWYQDFDPIICFEVDHDIWEIDSIGVNVTRAMVDGEQFELSNCGNCHLTFSLTWTTSSPLPWVYGYSAGVDKFVTRARFTEDLLAPAVYDPSRDYINDAITWSNADQFGPAGYDMGIDEIQYLWMEFLSPLGSSDMSYYLTPNVLTFRLEARANLP